MRVLLFFDLPTVTASDRRIYRQFRKTLIKNGFLMMQESVYCRLMMNSGAVKTLVDVIRKNKPSSGIVQVLTVTEKQFASMEYIAGSRKTDVIDSDERLIVL